MTLHLTNRREEARVAPSNEARPTGYSKRFDEALVWASELHRHQTRKGKLPGWSARRAQE